MKKLNVRDVLIGKTNRIMMQSFWMVDNFVNKLYDMILWVQETITQLYDTVIASLKEQDSRIEELERVIDQLRKD